MTKINPSFGNEPNKVNSNTGKTNLNAKQVNQEASFNVGTLKINNSDSVCFSAANQTTETTPPETPETKPKGFWGFWGSLFRGPIFRIGSDFGWGFGGPDGNGEGPLIA